MKAVIKILHAIFLVLSLGYLVYALASEGEEISRLFLQANLLVLMPALLLWPVSILITAVFACQVINSTGDTVSYRKVLAIYLNRIPAKYLPGGVWQTFARAYDLNSIGLNKTRIGVLVFYENFWTVMLAGLISGVLLLVTGSAGIYTGFCMLMLAGIALLVPAAFFLRNRPFILNVVDYLRLTVSGLVFWIVAGSCFLLYLHAFTGVMADQSLVMQLANYLFAYVIGFISIFTPQGVGVFEFVMTQLTEFSILQTQALVLLAGFRLIVLLGDMIAWCLFLVFNRIGMLGPSD